MTVNTNTTNTSSTITGAGEARRLELVVCLYRAEVTRLALEVLMVLSASPSAQLMLCNTVVLPSAERQACMKYVRAWGHSLLSEVLVLSPAIFVCSLLLEM